MNAHVIHASSHRVGRLPARKDLRRTFEQTARKCDDWQAFRRSVGRLIGTAGRTHTRSADWRSSAWRIAGQAWSDVHPHPTDSTLH